MTQPQQSLDEPRLDELLRLFPGEDLMRQDMTIVSGEDVKSPYDELLVHHHHMTVNLEEYHGSRVVLEVIDEHLTGDDYARKLLLRAIDSGRAVMLGIVQIDLRHCGFDVREEILAKCAPLGRILIEHNVLRWIEPHAYYQVKMNAALRSFFACQSDAESTYGRVAQIFCNGKPAIQLLEVVAPAD